MFVEYVSELSALETDGWRATQWSGAFAVFTSFVATLTSSVVPVGSFAFRVAVLLFVFGVGWIGMFFGVVMMQATAGDDGALDGTDSAGRRDVPGYNPAGDERSEV